MRLRSAPVLVITALALGCGDDPGPTGVHDQEALSITPVLEPAFEGRDYSGRLTATGGSGGYTWRLVSPPENFEVAPDGTVTGRAEHPLVQRITVEVSSGGASALAEVRVVVFRHQRVAPGSTHSCALDEEGAARCWGNGGSGALGDGGISHSNIPVAVESATRFVQISAGPGVTCALDTTGAPWCWGAGRTGFPRRLSESSYAAIEVDREVICALGAGGKVDCWDLDLDPSPSRDTPVGLPPIIRISGSCGLTEDGSTYCWSSQGVQEVAPSLQLGRFAGKSSHACGVSTDGAGYCWGENFAGQLGNGEFGPGGPTPVQVQVPVPLVRIATGAAHSCALDTDGGAWCWGYDFQGQVGDGGPIESLDHWRVPTPQPVDADLAFAEIFAFSDHTCAWTTSGEPYCWGLNEWGQLGDGSRTSRAVPVPVAGGLP